MAYFGKLPSGKWRTIVKVNGFQKTGTARTKAEVKAMAARFELELGQAPKGGSVSLGEMLHLHLEEQGYAATTLYDLRLIVAAIPDEVMAWRVADIEPFTIEQLYRKLRKDGWTAHRVRKLHMLLSSAWTHRAGEYGWSSKMLMRSVRAPKVDTPEVRPPTNVDVKRILAAVDSDVALFLHLAAKLGARRGELCGLQWDDVDIERRSVVIRRSASYVSGVGLVLTEGKSGRAGHRVIGAAQETIDLLATWKAEQADIARQAENLEPVWVFSHRSGAQPWRGDYISREFRRACQRIGLDDTHLHSLRHFMATQWLSSGDAATAVANRLGHTTTTTTLRVYAHYIGAGDHDAAERHAADLG